MAVVNVDYSEFETLKNRVKELEETVKEKDKTIVSLKDGSRVIIRKEVQIEYERFRNPFYEMGGIDHDTLYSQDDKPRRTVETSESYLGFEDVRLKVEDKMKDEINRSIKQRDESRESYESSVQKYKEKEKKLDDKEKSLNDKYAKKENDMAKVQIKSEKLTPFGGIFSIMEQFDALLAQTIDSTLGLRCTMFGYQYSEILRSLMCVYLCGGSCIEDVTTHLMKHLSLHPTLRTCSADTILRAIEELTFKSITYKSASGKFYDFNTADKMNCLLVNALLATGQLKSGQEYDFDFDHQFIETEKYDAKPTYKKFLGYSPGVAVINDMIVGIENRDGNTNVRFNQKETLERIFKRLEASEIYISRARMDCGSCSEEIVDMVEAHCRHFYIRANRCSSFYDSMFALTGWKTVEINGIEFELNSILVEKWKGKPYRLVIQRQRRIDGDLDIWEGEYTYRCILTNDYKSSARDIVEFYNLRGGKERIFDDMNNGFGWNRLPKSFMAQNTVFLLMTALIRNFYKAIMQRLKTHEFGLRATSRIKTFVFKFISVPAKWIKTSRRHVLNIYSDNNAYANLFKTDFG